jgi:hypothetical protein
MARRLKSHRASGEYPENNSVVNPDFRSKNK